MINPPKLNISIANKILPTLLSPIASLLFPLVPNKLLEHYQDGKMKLATLKNNQDIFNDLLENLRIQLKENNENMLKDTDPFKQIVYQEQINQVYKYSRYVSTIKRSLQYILDDERIDSSNDQNTPSPWYNMFQDVAMRMNEDWREDLLARCVAIEDRTPGSIALKTLWNIGMLESQTFYAFALFLDSSLDLDGYPAILLNRDDLSVKVNSLDRSYSGVLILLISTLIDHGLIQYGEFELSTVSPINVTCEQGSGKITNHKQVKGNETYIRFEGYHCTDLGLDLYRIYDPIYNSISKLNYKALYDIIKDSNSISLTNNIWS